MRPLSTHPDRAHELVSDTEPVAIEAIFERYAPYVAAISLRLGGRRLHWDSSGRKITNVPEANRFLTRDYRPDWEL